MRGAPASRRLSWQHRAVPQPIDNTCPNLTVLYDGACPLCRREIGIYQGLQPVEPTQTLKFTDISEPGTALPPGGVRSDYLARFHVQRSDGQVLSGAEAFVALWATLPGWRWLAKLAALPGATAAMEWLYCRFLVVRPWLQKAVVAFDKPKAGR